MLIAFLLYAFVTKQWPFPIAAKDEKQQFRKHIEKRKPVNHYSASSDFSIAESKETESPTTTIERREETTLYVDTMDTWTDSAGTPVDPTADSVEASAIESVSATSSDENPIDESKESSAENVDMSATELLSSSGNHREEIAPEGTASSDTFEVLVEQSSVRRSEEIGLLSDPLEEGKQMESVVHANTSLEVDDVESSEHGSVEEHFELGRQIFSIDDEIINLVHNRTPK